MSKSFDRWADQADEGDDLGGPWPDWEPLVGGEVAGRADDRMPENIIDLEPKWSAVDGQTYAHGKWDRTSTHGGGDSKGNEPDGQIAIYTGNWGGNWRKENEQYHMLRDAKSNPCHILCIQECTVELQRYLELPARDPDDGSDERFDKESKFLVVQGPEQYSLAIVVKETVAPAIRLQW